MANYLLQFAGMTFPLTFKPASLDSPIDTASQERPRADGSVQQPLRRKERKLVIQGDVVGDLDTFRAAFDTVKSACMAQGLAALYFGSDDRYIMAQCTGGTESWQKQGAYFGALATMELQFLAPDPFFLAKSTTDFDLGALGATIDVSGNAPTKPAYTVTIGTGGTAGVAVSNTTTGETMVLSPAFLPGGAFSNGDVIVADRAAYTVLYNGVATFGILTGQIPSLAAGSNVFTVSPADWTTAVVTISGAPTGGTFTITYGSDTTAGIAYDASAAAVQSALEALGSIGSGNVTVSDVVTGAVSNEGLSFGITFAGSFAYTLGTGMTASGSGLTGGTSSAATCTVTASGISIPSDVDGTYTARWF